MGHSLQAALSSPVELGLLFVNRADIFSSQRRSNCNYTPNVGFRFQNDLTVEKFCIIFHELVIYIFCKQEDTFFWSVD